MSPSNSTAPALPRVVGLTGGIGSGKSAVTERLEALGACVLDADAIAREVVDPGEPALEEIAKAFGREMLGDDGTLDRPRMAAQVFTDHEALARLEGITHPRILESVAQRLEALGREGWRWVVYEAALIVERGLHPELASLVVVSAPEPTRVRRVMERNRIPAQQVLSRMAAQARPATLIAAADHVVDNSGDLEALEQAVERLYEELAAELGAPRQIVEEP
jgi:dephospho-CoA kinase